MNSELARGRFPAGLLLAAICLLTACGQRPLAGPVLVIEPTASALHQIGHYSHTDEALVAKTGESGFLHFGPYVELPAGAYEAIFTVSVTGGKGPSGKVDVNAFMPMKPESILASVALASEGRRQTLTLGFTATPAAKYEFRVLSDGKSEIMLHKIVIKKH